MHRTRQILLVEDNVGDIELMERAISDMNARCWLAVVRDGKEALDFLERKGKHADAVRPDLILLDINMPAMNGVRFLGLIKADPRFATIPVIMVTSSADPFDVLSCYRAHVSCFLQKPFNAADYMASVRNLLNFWLDPAVRLAAQ